MKEYYVYIMANRQNGTLYIGITNNLIRRVYEHKSNLNPNSFTTRYNIHLLVYYEVYNNIWAALAREKNLKKWKRDWKIQLIEAGNPRWEELVLM